MISFGRRRRSSRSSFQPYLSLTLLCQFLLLLVVSAFLPPSQPWRVAYAGLDSSSNSSNKKHNAFALHSSKSSSTSSSSPASSYEGDVDKNTKYIEGLIQNLATILDKYILNGSPVTRQSAYNILEMIQTKASDQELVDRAIRMARRAGLPAAEDEPPETSSKQQQPKQQQRVDVASKGSDAARRKAEAEERKKWEASRIASEQTTGDGNTASTTGARSALGRRAVNNNNGKPDFMMGQIDSKLRFDPHLGPLEFEIDNNLDSLRGTVANSAKNAASLKVSELIARAGANQAFTEGIGGLDDVIAEVKRRIWIPLACPPQLLRELGIHPVRGLLLYGRPGCGKTLLARKLGQMLSPLRPITVVSGPEILDKFVGSSEKNLREIFDNPPDIYDTYRIGQADNGDAIAKAAMHVIIMDEFDAIARTRGGRGGKGDQGDAGVARDSVVNQLLAKMDGVEPLAVPTMVIGLTNKRSLIDPALLRPGRFEVQVEVPPPRTVEQRVSILRVHTEDMQRAGRLLVSDAPANSPATRRAAAAQGGEERLLSYQELLHALASECEGFSGASLAGVARAAASHALERAVEQFTQHSDDSSFLNDCVVTQGDLESAIQDVLNSRGNSDWAEEPNEVKENENATSSQDSDKTSSANS